MSECQRSAERLRRCTSRSRVRNQLTAVVKDQLAEGDVLIPGETGQHLAVDVSLVSQLPLLKPVEITGANQRVVP